MIFFQISDKVIHSACVGNVFSGQLGGGSAGRNRKSGESGGNKGGWMDGWTEVWMDD